MNRPKCPSCQGSDIRKLEGQGAVCKSCSKAKQSVFQFCWGCQREWPCGALTTGSCMLPNCALRAALLSVKLINDPESSVNGCPFFRACPGCQGLLTHNGDSCAHIVCPQCDEEFCFRCLRSECYNNEYYVNDDDDDDDDSDNDYDGPEIEPCVIVDNIQILQDLGL